MGKRSNGKFRRSKADFYRTQIEAIPALINNFARPVKYIEPCMGNGALIDLLDDYNFICTGGFDVEYQCSEVKIADATHHKYDMAAGEIFITNPPWTRKLLHPIIENLSDQAPTWLLFDADWIHTQQAIPYLCRLVKVVSVGRVEWFAHHHDSKGAGVDNCAWYLFDKPRAENNIQFIGRTK